MASPLLLRIDGPTRSVKRQEGVYFSQYSDDQPNILLVGPIPGDEHQEIVFPVLSPDPATDSSIHFGKYQIHVGGGRGRGRVYPRVRRATTPSTPLLQRAPSQASNPATTAPAL